MKAEEIPDKNLFMMCDRLNRHALTDLPDGYAIRNCRPDELDVWKMMPFNDAELATEYEGFMSDYFTMTYGGKEQLFFAKTLFVCDSPMERLRQRTDRPIATCASWRAYDEFTTIQWFKVLTEYEGRGIGRALLSIVMQKLETCDYPVYLHTQPSSFRAIKLYADFRYLQAIVSVLGKMICMNACQF
jgi:ribosomal protein S18 acetylase RimI-like enzyme